MPVYSKVKLTAINYKIYGNGVGLAGIQLQFTNNIQSPFYETDGAVVEKVKMKTITVDPNRLIKEISMNVHSNKFLRGIRLVDEVG